MPNSTEELEAACRKFVESITSIQAESQGTTVEELAIALMDTLDNALKVVPRLLHERAAAARQERNRVCSAFCKLPDELLAIILQGSLSIYSGESHYLRLYALISVCAPFRRIIHSTPSFWTLIDEDLSEEPLALALEQSRLAPLSVTCSEGFLEQLQGMSKPIRSLSMRIFDNEPTKTLFMPFPYLEALRLRYYKGTMTLCSATEEPFSGEAPRLTEVELNGVWIPGKVLTGLTSFYLKNIDRSGPTVQEVRQMLLGSPALECLHFSAVDLAQAKPSSHENAGQIISLPRLKELHFENVHSSTTAAILGTIRISSACEQFEVTPCYMNNAGGHYQSNSATEGSMPLEYLKHLGPHFKTLIKRSDIIHLILDRQSFELTTAYLGDTKLGLFGLDIDIVEWLPWLTEIVASSVDADDAVPNTVAVRLDLSVGGEILETLDKVRVDNVHAVDDVNADPLLEYLSGHTSSNWTMPWLKVLRVEGQFTTEKLLGMMRRRYGEGNGQKTPTDGKEVGLPSGLPRPADLQYICISGNDDSVPGVLAEIEDIVQSRGGSVIWTATKRRAESLLRDVFGSSDGDSDGSPQKYGESLVFDDDN